MEKLNYGKLCLLLRAVRTQLDVKKDLFSNTDVDQYPHLYYGLDLEIGQLKEIETILEGARSKVLNNPYKSARIEVEF